MLITGIVSVVAGAVLVVSSPGLPGTGGTALRAQMQRHGGRVHLGTASCSVPGHAIASEAVETHMASGGWDAASALIGTVRIRVPRQAAAARRSPGSPRPSRCRYLTGMAYATVTGTADHRGTYTEHAGPRLPSRRAIPASGPRRRPGRVPRP